jgi:hypothetical protein
MMHLKRGLAVPAIKAVLKQHGEVVLDESL